MGICPLAVDSYVSATTHQGAFWSALYLQLCLSLVFCECDSWFPEEPQVPGSQPFFWAGFLCPAGPALVPARCGTWWLRCEENHGRTHCTAAQGFSTLTNSSAHTLNYCLEDKKWCSQYFEFDGFMLWSFLILLQCRFLKLWCSYLWAYWLVGFHIYVFIFPSMQHGSLCCVTTFRKWSLYRTYGRFASEGILSLLGSPCCLRCTSLWLELGKQEWKLPHPQERSQPQPEQAPWEWMSREMTAPLAFWGNKSANKFQSRTITRAPLWDRMRPHSLAVWLKTLQEFLTHCFSMKILLLKNKFFFL